MNVSSFYLIFVTYIVPPTVLIPIAFALINFKWLTMPLKIIFWFLVFSGLANLVSLILIYNHHTTTWMVHIYTIFEFLFMSLFYGTFYSKKGQNIIAAIVSLFAILCIVNFVFIQNKIEFNTYTRPVEAIAVIIYSLLYMLSQNNDEQNWGDNIYNWINAGILIYFASGLFMFIFSNYMLSASIQFNRIMWTLHDTILIFEYLLFAVGFYKCKPQQTISLY